VFTCRPSANFADLRRSLRPAVSVFCEAVHTWLETIWKFLEVFGAGLYRAAAAAATLSLLCKPGSYAGHIQ
jgi:hypothetical protein